MILPWLLYSYQYFINNNKIQTMLWLQIFAVFLLVLYLTVFRPRKGGKDAPPMVLESPVFPIPIIGVIMEFFKSPNSMVKRCHKDYGPVFTIPVSLHCPV